MARSRRGAAPRDIVALFRVGTTGGLSDERLLERSLGPDAEAARLAFAELVSRHGPMVLRVCGSLLRDPHDAEDAFQATFLVLARRGRSIRKKGSVASWLHGVARRVAMAARSEAARRRRHEGRAGIAADATAERSGRDEVGEVVQEEVQGLPERYRTAIVLCDLEGLTEGQAAQQLGWPIGTVRTRLRRGRERLRGRLTRRGLAPAMVGAASSGPAEAAPAVPAALRDAAAEAAVRFATVGKAPAALSLLSERVLRAMFLTRLKVATAALIVVGAASSMTIVAEGWTQAPPGSPPRPSPQEQRPRRRSIAEKLEDPVAMQFPNETPLGDVLRYIKAATKGPGDDAGLPIFVDPIGLMEVERTLDSTVSIDVEHMPLRATLPRVLKPLGLEYLVGEDVVIVSSPRVIEEERQRKPTEAADRSPATAAALARMGETVPMRFNKEVTLGEALRTIEEAVRGRHPEGIRLLVDAEGLWRLERTLDSTIEIDVEGISPRTALRLIRMETGLDYIVRDGLVIISCPERLETLRGQPGDGPRSGGGPKG